MTYSSSFLTLSLSQTHTCIHKNTRTQHAECLFPELQLLLFLDCYWLSQAYKPCLKAVSVDVVCDRCRSDLFPPPPTQHFALSLLPLTPSLGLPYLKPYPSHTLLTWLALQRNLDFYSFVVGRGVEVGIGPKIKLEPTSPHCQTPKLAKTCFY